ncbi:MAG: tyrosine-type recombinase/integrase [Verrucomicrobiia bacterium]
MKRDATDSNSRSQSRRYQYTKVLDNRKHPIRGLWRRGGKFLARITVEDDAGKKEVKWVPLKATTPGAAQDEFRTVLVERKENRLRHIGRCPTLADYWETTYLPALLLSGKKPDTVTTEKVHMGKWVGAIGHLHLDKIRPSHVNTQLLALKAAGLSSRTRNLSLIELRNVLKAAKVDGFINTLPVDGIAWEDVETKQRPLYTRDEIELFCEAARTASKNGEQFGEYFRLLALTGAREQEALKIRWTDVHFDQRRLCAHGHLVDEPDRQDCPDCGSRELAALGSITIGADADTKNREARTVDFNQGLYAHLRNMERRRAPDSQWLFPSPQRGDRDEHAKTFRETLLLTRQVGGAICGDCGKTTFGENIVVCSRCESENVQSRKPALSEKLQKIGFHDNRHHFISMCVMSGVDFMTIAKWVGHKDGGVLIGKVYGHLADEHRRRMAQKVTFGPVFFEAAASF